jgi:hypothetical protein
MLKYHGTHMDICGKMNAEGKKPSRIDREAAKEFDNPNPAYIPLELSDISRTVDQKILSPLDSFLLTAGTEIEGSEERAANLKEIATGAKLLMDVLKGAAEAKDPPAAAAHRNLLRRKLENGK